MSTFVYYDTPHKAFKVLKPCTIPKLPLNYEDM